MSTTLALILLGVACVIFFVGYVFGEAVGYRCGVNDEASRYHPDCFHCRKDSPYYVGWHIEECPCVCHKSEGVKVEVTDYGHDGK